MKTRALSLTGFVRFTAPAGHQPDGGPGRGIYVRCRVLSGRFECPPRLRHIAFNAVTRHALSQREKLLGDCAAIPTLPS